MNTLLIFHLINWLIIVGLTVLSTQNFYDRTLHSMGSSCRWNSNSEAMFPYLLESRPATSKARTTSFLCCSIGPWRYFARAVIRHKNHVFWATNTFTTCWNDSVFEAFNLIWNVEGFLFLSTAMSDTLMSDLYLVIHNSTFSIKIFFDIGLEWPSDIWKLSSPDK